MNKPMGTLALIYLVILIMMFFYNALANDKNIYLYCNYDDRTCLELIECKEDCPEVLPVENVFKLKYDSLPPIDSGEF